MLSIWWVLDAFVSWGYWYICTRRCILQRMHYKPLGTKLRWWDAWLELRHSLHPVSPTLLPVLSFPSFTGRCICSRGWGLHVKSATPRRKEPFNPDSFCSPTGQLPNGEQPQHFRGGSKGRDLGGGGPVCGRWKCVANLFRRQPHGHDSVDCLLHSRLCPPVFEA